MKKMINLNVLKSIVQALLPETVPASEFERMVTLDEILGFAQRFQVPMAVPQNIEAQRKNFVFSAMYRRRIQVQTLEVSQLWEYGQATKFCKVKTGIDTLYGGYAHDQLIKAGLLRVLANKLRDAHGSGIVVNGSTLDIVVISWKGIGKSDSPVRRVAKSMVREFWVVENDSCKNGYSVLYRNRHHKLVSLNGIVNDLDDDHLMHWLQNGTARHYVYFIDSPSGYRQGMMPAFCVPWEQEHRWKEWMEEVLDIATGGQFSIMKEAHAGKPIGISKGIKDIGRMSLGVTPSTLLGLLNNIAIYCGELEVTDENGNKIIAGDGNSLNAIEAICELATARMGCQIEAEDARKFGGQQRVNSFWKGHNIVVYRETILTIIEYLVRTGVIKEFIYLERTREDSIRFEKLRGVPYEEGGFGGCLVIFGDLDKVEMFGDLTCVKCSTDFSKSLELRLMDISHTPHGYIPLSKQGLIQMQLTGDEFLKMDKAVTPAAIDRMFRQVEFDDVDEVIGDIDPYGDEIRTTLNLSEDVYSFSAIQQMCPEAQLYDTQIKRVILQSVTDTVNKRLNRFNLTTEGSYLKLVPDIGRFFNIRLLEDNEFYAPSIRPVKDDTGFDAVIIRYPLVDFGAFIPGRSVSKQELAQRIRKAQTRYRYKGVFYDDMEMDLSKALFDLMHAVTGAMAMIASMVKGTMNKLSGADFDGDGGCFFTATAIKMVYSKLKSYSNEYGGSCSTDLKVEFNYDLGPTSFLYAWALESDDRKPNAAIGMIAGLNVTASSMLIGVLMGKLTPEEVFHWFLDKLKFDKKLNKYRLILAKPGADDYHRLFTVDHSDDLGVDVSFEGHEATYVDDFIDAVRRCNWSFESCVRMLYDFNAVLSKCMNDTIDAAKNGAVVYVPFLDVLTMRVRSSSVASIDYAEIKLSRTDLKFEGPNNGFTGPCCSEASKKEQNNPYFTLLKNDPIGMLKNRIFTIAYLKIRKALTDNVESDLTEVSAGMYLDSSLDLMASYYQDLMKAEANNKTLGKKVVVSMTYTLLSMCKVTDPERILSLILRASNYKKHVPGATPKYSSFYAAFNEVIRHYVAKLCPDMIFTLPVFKFGGGFAYIGQEVTFEDGRSKDGFYVDGKVSGTFTLEANEFFQPIIRRRALDMIPAHEGEQGVAVFKLWKKFWKDSNGKIQDLSPKYNADNLIGFIENKRDKENLECWVQAYDPEKKVLLDTPVNEIQNLTKVALMLVTNYGRIGFIQNASGRVEDGYHSAYLDAVIGKRFSIENVMKMGREDKKNQTGQESICVIAKEIPAA